MESVGRHVKAISQTAANSYHSSLLIDVERVVVIATSDVVFNVSVERNVCVCSFETTD
jgi:hypothetical protein